VVIDALELGGFDQSEGVAMVFPSASEPANIQFYGLEQPHLTDPINQISNSSSIDYY